MQYLVPPKAAHFYGMRGVVIYASSHPSDPSCLSNDRWSTYRPYKCIFGIGGTDFEKEFVTIYEDIHDRIVLAIKAELPGRDWELNVLRMGFYLEPIRNPITIHLNVVPGKGEAETLSRDAASKIVSDILALLGAAPLSSIMNPFCLHPGSPELAEIHYLWAVPPYYDNILTWAIIQDPRRRLPRTPSESNAAVNVRERNPGVYKSSARLPYSSIGSPNTLKAGTLTGYIQHRDEDGRNTVYALTCRHVVDPDDLLSEKPCFENTGQIQRQVTSPAVADHEETIEDMQLEIGGLRSAGVSQIDADTSAAVTTLEQALEMAEQYKIDLGYVCATSGRGRKLPEFEGRSDWAIISITDPSMAENKHVRTSDYFLSFKPPKNLPIHDSMAYGMAASAHFYPGPHFKPIRDGDLLSNELVFKPRSRSLNEAVGGTFNGIRSTREYLSFTTREWCFLPLVPKKPMSSPGDSGSVIIDKDFRPVAMIWGGDDHEFAGGLRDLTYASPLSKVLRDIELRLEWAEGSVSMV